MALTKNTGAGATIRVPEAEPTTAFLARPLVVVAFALALMAALGWQLMIHPTWTAPTRDPAWYTWRANVILTSSPGSIAREWGPSAVFSGGYRVTSPLAGALLQRVAGIDQYSFSALMMIGIPVLAGLALGAAGYRSRKDPLIIPVTMLATAALFLTTPYVGYLDDTLMLFLLCLMLAFLGPARTSWPARVAVFLIGMTAAFTHPTTCVLFGLTLMGVFGFHFLTSRFSLGAALKSDGPMLLSAGFGMIFGLALWLGVWGPAAKFSDAAAPPPYTKSFFEGRLKDWVLSLQPIVIVPLILVAIGSVVLLARRERKPAGTYETVAIWWLLPFAGALTFLLSAKPVPYYRFMNASAAVMPLAGIGAFFAIRRFLRLSGAAKLAGLLASLLVVGALGWVFFDGLHHRWVTENNQWADQNTRIALAAVHEVVAAAGERPNILVVNFRDTNDGTGTNVGYGWAKTYTNVYRTGLPGTAAQYSATYFGKLGDFLQGVPTTGRSKGYDDWSRNYFDQMQAKRAQFPAAPVVFLYGGFYSKGSDPVGPALAQGTPIGPGVVAINGPGLWQPPADVVSQAQAAAAAEGRALATHAGPFGDPVHTLRVLIGVFLLAVLPGLIASPFFELDDGVARVALIPGISIVLTLLSGIALLAVWRGPLTTLKGYAVVVVATGAAAALRLRGRSLVGALEPFGAFFNRMFAVFSNRSFSALMGTQFVAQMADGIVQGALFKTIAFGGDKGFNLSNAPSARYVLGAVLLLYVPYTLVSPFAGVAIDRFDRKKLLVRSNAVRAAVVAAVALIGFGHVPNGVLVATLVVALAGTRMLLAIKSAGIPAVLKGRDLLQGNGLSQAGGALFQVIGLGIAGVGSAKAPAAAVALFGAVGYLVAAIVARNCDHLEYERRETRLADEIRKVFADIAAGLREVRRRPPAALALSSFQALRIEAFGFVGLAGGLEARTIFGSHADKTPIYVAGATAALGAAIGMVIAQRLKDRVPPARILVAAMALMGTGVLVFGGITTQVGFGMLAFMAGFGFFLGKISADTIMQQALPDRVRGRGFSLFDIAYNLGWIVPALILVAVWSDQHVRQIMVGSGIAFLVFTALIARWASAIKAQLAPQDDLVDEPAR